MRIAYLAPEIPSVSATFVYREIQALEASTTHRVTPFSLHPVAGKAIAADGRAFLNRTEVVYASRPKLVRAGLVAVARHPLRALRAMGCALRDLTEEPARPLRLAGQALAGIALGRTLLRRGIEHLHVHFAHAPATVGMYAAAYAGIPFSVTGHANDLYVHPQLLRAKLRRATPFATISEENRRFLLRELGAVAARVKLVRCGVDTERFQPHGARDDVPLVFSTGRLVPKKGLDLLLKSLARVVTPWRCVIAGDGPQHAELQRLARRLGIARRVRFLGAVDTATVRSYLRRAHVFVLPCRQAADGDIDGIPVALMEAMAMEVPVVSTRVSGIPELIEDRVSGRLVAPENTLELTYAISEILACSEHARSLGRAARAKVAAEFDLHRNARRLAGAFQTEARAASPLRIETRLGVASPNTPA